MYKKKFKKKKKNFYSKEDSEDEILFMGTVTQASEDDSDVEGEVDLKVELISALEELRKSRMKNKSLKEKLSKDKESTQMIIDVKKQLQEAKRIE